MEARLGIQFHEGTRRPKRVGVIMSGRVVAYLSIRDVQKMASDLDHLEVASEYSPKEMRDEPG